MKKDNTILLIGCGPMAIEYAKVLKKLEQKFIVVGRGKESAIKFLQAVGKSSITGGIEKFFKNHSEFPPRAIVAVSEDQLGKATLLLLQKGVKLILVEKPGGLNFEEIERVNQQTIKTGAHVFVAYNRRFYSSVKKAKEIIEKDGGVSSFYFEFTELSNIINHLKKGPGVKENWFLQNSTHVIDLAFFLGGRPKKISSYVKGKLRWHPHGSIFVGCGESQTGALFSYNANWEAPGRWGVEVLTRNYRLILRPLEKLQIQKKGSFELTDINLDDALDTSFKPGLFRQVESFLGKKDSLCTIQEQYQNLKWYRRILEGE